MSKSTMQLQRKRQSKLIAQWCKEGFDVPAGYLLYRTACKYQLHIKPSYVCQPFYYLRNKKYLTITFA